MTLKTEKKNVNLILFLFFEAKNPKLFTVPCRVQLQLNNGILRHAEFHKLDSHSRPDSKTEYCFWHKLVGRNRAWLAVWADVRAGDAAGRKVEPVLGYTQLYGAGGRRDR